MSDADGGIRRNGETRTAEKIATEALTDLFDAISATTLGGKLERGRSDFDAKSHGLQTAMLDTAEEYLLHRGEHSVMKWRCESHPRTDFSETLLYDWTVGDENDACFDTLEISVELKFRRTLEPLSSIEGIRPTLPKDRRTRQGYWVASAIQHQ